MKYNSSIKAFIALDADDFRNKKLGISWVSPVPCWDVCAGDIFPVYTKLDHMVLSRDCDWTDESLDSSCAPGKTDEPRIFGYVKVLRTFTVTSDITNKLDKYTIELKWE